MVTLKAKLLLGVIALAGAWLVYSTIQQNGELRASLKHHQSELVKAALSANQAASEAQRDIQARDVALESARRSADFNIRLAANLETQLREVALADENLDRCLGVRLPDAVSLPE